MVALLEEFPGVQMTFNLVPSLLVQLEAFAEGRAHDRYLELGLKPADRLTTATSLHPRELLSRPAAADDRHLSALCRTAGAARRLVADRGGRGGPRARFTRDDLRDLQVWHKLAWIDPFYLDGDARVRALVDKGRGYTEEDKRPCATSSSSC